LLADMQADSGKGPEEQSGHRAIGAGTGFAESCAEKSGDCPCP